MILYFKRLTAHSLEDELKIKLKKKITAEREKQNRLGRTSHAIYKYFYND